MGGVDYKRCSGGPNWPNWVRFLANLTCQYKFRTKNKKIQPRCSARVFGCSLFSPPFLPFFFRNILEQYVFKATLCIIFPSLPSSYLFSSIIFWRARSSGCLAGLSIRRRLVYSPPTGLLCCGRTSSLDQGLPLQPSTKSLSRGILERGRFIPSHNNAKNVLKIIVHCRSNMIITDLLPGAPWILSSCFFSSYSFLLAAHPDYTSVWEQ